MGVACCGLPPLAVAYSASFKAAERQFTTSGEILHRVGSVGAERSPPHKAQSDFISRVSTVLNVRLSPTPFVGLSHLTCLSGFEIGLSRYKGISWIAQSWEFDMLTQAGAAQRHQS